MKKNTGETMKAFSNIMDTNKPMSNIHPQLPLTNEHHTLFSIQQEVTPAPSGETYKESPETVYGTIFILS